MQSDELNERAGRSGRRSNRLELFFYERVGARYYLRFTRLALILIVCLTLIPILLLFTLYLSRKRGGPMDVDVKIVVPTPAPHDYNRPIIQPVVPPITPPKVRQPGVGASPRQTPPAPNRNANGSFTPSPTPSPMLARPPT